MKHHTLRSRDESNGVREAERDQRVRFPVRASVRLSLSLLVGLGITLAYLLQSADPKPAKDLTPILMGTRMILQGHSPFVRDVALDGTGARMLYPMPTYLLFTPIAWLPGFVVRALWSGFAAAMLMWLALGRWGIHGVAAVFSRCGALAISIAQFSPYFFFGALIPGWQVIAAAKPTLGFIVWCYRPSWWPFIGGVVLIGGSFLVLPSWLTEWRSQLSGVGWYLPAAAIWRGGGPLLLLAALRWRRPEGRLLLALACVPHNFAWYDQLLVFLVAQRPRELWSLFILSWLAALGSAYALFDLGYINRPDPFSIFRIPIVALLYLPALMMVLRRPNEGALPRWMEGCIAGWPRWVRGAPASEIL
jgi:hypothetical protein